MVSLPLIIEKKKQINEEYLENNDLQQKVWTIMFLKNV